MRSCETPRFRELHITDPRRSADFLGPGMSDRDVTRRAFLQQQFGRLDARLRMKPFAHPSIEEDVGDGNHRHALMMRHECPYDGNPGSLGQTAASVVERLKETVSAACADHNESRKIERSAFRIDHHGQGRRVGRDHGVFAQAPFEPQARYAEVRILVGELQVARVVGGLRNAPGKSEFATVLNLPLDDQAIGLFQKAPGWRTHDERWHQVFEHRPRPRNQRCPMCNGCDSASQPKPVATRHVVLGNGHEARQTCLGSEQVVAARIERALGRAVADREEATLGIKQKAELHRVGHRLRGRFEDCQPPPQSQGRLRRET